MKRWRILILALCCTILAMVPVSANMVRVNDNREVELLNMDLDSVQVLMYNPPNYIIQFKLKGQDTRLQIVDELTIRMYYDYDKQEMKSQLLSIGGAMYHGSQRGPWMEFPRNEPLEDAPSESGRAFMGNLAFYKAYHMYFYKSWQDAYGVEDITNRKLIPNLPK